MWSPSHVTLDDIGEHITLPVFAEWNHAADALAAAGLQEHVLPDDVCRGANSRLDYSVSVQSSMASIIAVKSVCPPRQAATEGFTPSELFRKSEWVVSLTKTPQGFSLLESLLTPDDLALAQGFSQVLLDSLQIHQINSRLDEQFVVTSG